PWPDEYVTNMEAVINHISSNFGGYTDKLCTGPIPITYESTQAYSGGKAYGGELLGDGTITIYPFGINQGFGSNLYTLAHETGHFFKPRNIDIWNLFSEERPWATEGYIDTYPLSPSDNEDFAETIGVYIAGPSYPRVDVLDRYPKHRQFAQSNIFN
ncbi:MAG: hypothetical protein ACD_40C00141G0001, partial [uncultured bacterium]